MTNVFLFQRVKCCSARFLLKGKCENPFWKTHKLFNASSVSFSPLTQRSFMAHFSSNSLAAEASSVNKLTTQNSSIQVCFPVTSLTLPAACHWNPHLSFTFDRTELFPCVSFLSSPPDVSIKCLACTRIDEGCNSTQHISFHYIFFSKVMNIWWFLSSLVLSWQVFWIKIHS